jgi:hypothetical protein
MKASSNYRVVAVFAAVLLLAGLIVSQQLQKQSAAKRARFTEQYTLAMQQLNAKIDSVRKKMKRNEVLLPDLTSEAAKPEPLLVPLAEAVPEPLPGPPAVKKEPVFKLQGISWNQDSPLVLIDDRVYKTGDRINGFVVVQILQQEIILKDANGVLHKITLIKEVKP